MQGFIATRISEILCHFVKQVATDMRLVQIGRDGFGVASTDQLPEGFSNFLEIFLDARRHLPDFKYGESSFEVMVIGPVKGPCWWKIDLLPFVGSWRTS